MLPFKIFICLSNYSFLTRVSSFRFIVYVLFVACRTLWRWSIFWLVNTQRQSRHFRFWQLLHEWLFMNINFTNFGSYIFRSLLDLWFKFHLWDFLWSKLYNRFYISKMLELCFIFIFDYRDVIYLFFNLLNWYRILISNKNDLRLDELPNRTLGFDSQPRRFGFFNLIFLYFILFIYDRLIIISFHNRFICFTK